MPNTKEAFEGLVMEFVQTENLKGVGRLNEFQVLTRSFKVNPIVQTANLLF